jgi:3-hydroxyacyl-[acyl-carrier-protein] dehydratase
MLTLEQVSDLIPQKPPFRFVDRLTELDDEHVAGEYLFRPDEPFYAGHFPGFPVTPGVILVESMCQTAFALAIRLLSADMPVDDIGRLVMVLTESSVEFERVVKPGDAVRMTARKVFWRRRKLKAEVALTLRDGTPVCRGTVGGMGVPRDDRDG